MPQASSDTKPKVERGPFPSFLRKLSPALYLVQLVNSYSYLKALRLLPPQVIDEAQTLIGLAQEKPRIQKKMPNGHPDVASIQCEWGGLGRISLWTSQPHELKPLVLVMGEPLLFVQSGQYCKKQCLSSSWGLSFHCCKPPEKKPE